MKRGQVALLLLIGLVVAVLLSGRGTEIADQVVAFVMRRLGAKEQANRQALIPSARLALDGLREEMEREHGIKLHIGSTRRTDVEQAQLVANNASATQNSWHKLGRAVDVYCYDPKTGKLDMDGVHWDTLYRKLHQVAPRHGWRGLAFNADGTKRFLVMKDGRKKWDGGHLEFPEGMTFAQARAAAGKAVA